MLVNVLLIGAIIYIVIVLLAYFFQKKIIYYPFARLSGTPVDVNLEYEDINFTTGDSVPLHGWFIPADSARGTLLFCHGNAGNISNRLESIRQFVEIGLNVFIFDYRGYGQSKGQLSEKGTYLDAEAAWDYLVNNKNIDPETIVIFGRSLGGAVAVNLATVKAYRALIVESSFTSMPDIAANNFPWLPARWLCRYKYNSYKKIPTIKRPILIIHSPDDDLIPYKHGQKLFERANQPKRFLKISGLHNDGYLTTGTIYRQGISDFLSKFISRP